MNKLSFFLIAFLLIGFQSNAQYFQKQFEQDDNIDMVLVTKEMFSLINEINSGKNKDLKDFYAQLSYLGMFNANNPASIDKIRRTAVDYVHSKDMKLLVKIKNSRKTAGFYYVPADKPGYAKELILLVYYPQEKKISLLHVKGLINMKKLSYLALQATNIDKELLQKAEQSVK